MPWPVPRVRCACFVINAPAVVSYAWRILKPVLNESTRQKVVISSGVPDSLVEALGGEQALRAVMASVPPLG